MAKMVRFKDYMISLQDRKSTAVPNRFVVAQGVFSFHRPYVIEIDPTY